MNRVCFVNRRCNISVSCSKGVNLVRVFLLIKITQFKGFLNIQFSNTSLSVLIFNGIPVFDIASKLLTVKYPNRMHTLVYHISHALTSMERFLSSLNFCTRPYNRAPASCIFYFHRNSKFFILYAYIKINVTFQRHNGCDRLIRLDL